jgi:hypothetical protein
MSEHGSGTKGAGARGEGPMGGAPEGAAGMGGSAAGGYGQAGQGMPRQGRAADWPGAAAGAYGPGAQASQEPGAGGPAAGWPRGTAQGAPQGQWGQSQTPQGYGQGMGEMPQAMPHVGMMGPGPFYGAPMGMGYPPPQAPWPYPGYYPYPYPPQPPMGHPQAQAQAQSGDGSAAGAALRGRAAGMAQLMEEMGAGNGLSGLVQMLNLDDKELWKGALLGAAVVLLLTNESVQNSLFKTGVRARDAVKSGVDKIKTQARDAGAAEGGDE